MKPILAWWFGSDKLPHGDGRAVTVGSRLRVPPPVKLCRRGLHGSVRVFNALCYATTDTLWRTKHSGTVVHGRDKLVSSVRTHLARINAGPILRAFAQRCTLDIISLRNAPEAVREYLTTGNRSPRAAAKDVVKGAAWDAARDKYAMWLEDMCLEAVP